MNWTWKHLAALVIVLVILVVAVCSATDCGNAAVNMRKWKKVEEPEGEKEPEEVTPDSKEGFTSDPQIYRAGINDERDDDVNLETLAYQEALPQLGLEQGVRDSHKSWLAQPGRVTNTSSAETVREYDEGPVKRVGLRFARYDPIMVGATARTVPSEYSDQLMQSDRYVL